MKSRRWLALLLTAALESGAHAARPAEVPMYPWQPQAATESLVSRFSPPPGARRVDAEAGSFAAFLRYLPLLPAGSPVLLYDGQKKSRQDVHAAVVDLDVGKRDLQQCADAAMRLRAEYLYWVGRFADIRFHPEPGRPKVLAYSGGADRARFGRYLTQLFSDAGSASLQAELGRRSGPVQPGDVLIQGGHPGHVVVVLDVAVASGGQRYLLLGQSYMPAQQFHVLRNLQDAALSPWFNEAALDGDGLRTPEWPAFSRSNVRTFE